MYKKLVFIATLLTFIVVVLGAYVRLSDAGLGCPDWPGCYGQPTPAHAAEEIAAAHAVHPEGPVSLHKAWKEMVHRYFASSLGLLMIAIAIISWRQRKVLGSPVLPFSIVALVIFQGMLGMWTVTLLLKPAIVTSHLLGGLALLALLSLLALRQSESIKPINVTLFVRLLAIISLVFLCIQIALGGWVSTNYAALACTDFPLCQGQLMPQMDFHNAFHVVRELGMTAQGELLSLSALRAIHWMHRVGALVVTIVVGFLGFRLLLISKARGWGVLVLSILSLQALLGIANVYMQLPLILAVAHNVGAALFLVTLVAVNFVLRRVPNKKQAIDMPHSRIVTA